MPSFARLREQNAVSADKGRTFVLYRINKDNPPELDVRSATKANKAWWNANQTATASDLTLTAAKRGTITVEAQLAIDRIDMRLYAEHVVYGWRNVIDDEGTAVPFSPGVCAEFLAAIDSDSFEELREFCRHASNFTNQAIDQEAVAKNS